MKYTSKNTGFSLILRLVNIGVIGAEVLLSVAFFDVSECRDRVLRPYFPFLSYLCGKFKFTLIRKPWQV